MFEEILSKKAIETIETLSPELSPFYLAGGTGLSLQLGHRKSDDLDFFTENPFNTDTLLSSIKADRIFFTAQGTVHCEKSGIMLSFLFYNVPLVHAPISWRGIKIAHCEDITAEKIKAISQRGAKKDFIDLYAILKTNYTIPEVCDLFKKRFRMPDENLYHVVKSLVFFEDAEMEPSPSMIFSGNEWSWDIIKAYFVENIAAFEREFGLE
jgi:Nucleotidyl transferase AbiEii toxin, Type IV TA system